MTPEERAHNAIGWYVKSPPDSEEQQLLDDIAAALREAVEAERRACAEVAQKHGDFCDREARNGGSRDLFERAKGAWHIARAIEARKEA